MHDPEHPHIFSFLCQQGETFNLQSKPLEPGPLKSNRVDGRR